MVSIVLILNISLATPVNYGVQGAQKIETGYIKNPYRRILIETRITVYTLNYRIYSFG